MLFQSAILRIVAPDEFAKQTGYFKYEAAYTNSAGWIIQKEIMVIFQPLYITSDYRVSSERFSV